MNTKINKQTTKLTLSSTYINRNTMINHVSECVYTMSYQPNRKRLKILFLICLTEHLIIYFGNTLQSQ